MNSSPLDANLVASAFLYQIPEEVHKSGDGINSIKLHKLLFFAQEEYLVRYKKPLFLNEITAEKHGMVIKDVIINGINTGLNNRHSVIQYRPETLSLDLFSTEQYNVINLIWTMYGRISSWCLEELNHAYSIWKDNVNSNKVITTETILLYKQKINEAEEDGVHIVDNIFASFSDKYFEEIKCQ